MYLLPVAVAFAEEGAGPGGPGGIASMLPFIILIVVFYFLLIRPQQKSAKKHRELLEQLKPGDRVVTRGGIHGRVQSVKDDLLVLEIADNVRIQIEKNAIQGKRVSSEGGGSK